MKRILMSWSSGKDSAWALKLLREQGEMEVAGLLTTINQAAGRVAMHGVRESLVDAQAAAAGLALWKIPLPWPCSNEDYQHIMRGCCDRAVREGIDGIAFGDLFLADVRRYRETQLRDTGLEPIFPLWGLPTPRLAREMISSGLRAKLAVIDPKRLSPVFAGREFDERLLAELPAGVDPCGEYGEFHSFVYHGPMFCHPVEVALGEIVTRDGFVFADLKPVASPATAP